MAKQHKLLANGKAKFGNAVLMAIVLFTEGLYEILFNYQLSLPVTDHSIKNKMRKPRRFVLMSGKYILQCMPFVLWARTYQESS